jgi:hypothetical protein
MRDGLIVRITGGPFKHHKGTVYRSRKSDDSKLLGQTVRVLIGNQLAIPPRGVVSPIPQPKQKGSAS